MYLDYYQLNAKPFDLSPGPRFLWLGEKHNEALATLNYGIMEDLGFLLLTGDVGVGKTALIHRLIDSLDSSTIVAHITDPGLGTIDFFKLLAVEFNIPIEFHGKGEFLIELEKFLYAAHSDHKKVLLIVDEAQRLNNKLLDQVRVLSNIELSDRKLINIFFVGQPEFKTLLMADSNRAIRQRIAINYHINPLTESETGQYIAHRLKVAGATRQIFKPKAVREIFRFTGGFPRSINVICDHALVTGYTSGLKSINSAVIEECEHELSIRAGAGFSWTDFQKPATRNQPDTRQPAPHRSKSMASPILIAICIVLGALVSYFLLWPPPQWTMTTTNPDTLADALNRQSVSDVKDPTQAASKNEIALAKPYEVEDTRKEPVPEDEIATADRRPAIHIEAGKAKKTSAPLSASSDTESKIRTAEITPNAEATKQTVGGPKEKIADSGDQPDIFTAQAKPAPEPFPYISKENSDGPGVGKTEADAAVAATLGADDRAAVPADEFAPEAESPTDTPALESPVTASGKAAAAMVAVLTASQTEPEADPVPQEGTVAQQAPPVPKTGEVADGQTEVPATKVAPKAEPPTDTPAVERDAATPGKAGAGAAAVAVVAAKPEPKADPVPRKETVAQQAPPVPKTGKVADGQTEVPATKVAPKAEPPTDTPAVERDAATPGKAGAGAAAVAVVAAKPKPPVKPATTVSQAGTQSTTSKSKPGNRSAPPTAAKTDTQLQLSSQRIGGTAASVKKPNENDLKNRLQLFLQNYCTTYAAKDLDAFTNLFIPDARENGTPFIRLLPKYKKNFDYIEAIEYRIELKQFTYDENMGIAKIDGDFFLKWLPPNKKWRENTGKISMSLQEKGQSFLVRELDYQGGRSTKN